jgi:hypothetical protein
LESRRQYLVFFALVAIVAAVGFVFARRSSAPPSSALSAIPDDAWLVLSVDVDALRASGLGAAVQSTRAAGTSGFGALADQCGFDPLEHVRDLVVASPEGGETGDFGVVFETDVSQGDLSACATKVITARGGTPQAKSRAGFEIIEDGTNAGHARLAYRTGGPYLVGRGEWLDRMIDRAAGPAAPTESATAAEHVDLRKTLVARAGKPAVLLTAVLPKGLRERLKGELSAELGSEGDTAYASVLSIEAAGLAVTTGRATTTLEADLRCETPSACDAVKTVLERKLAAFSRSVGRTAEGSGRNETVGVRLVGLGPLLDSLRLDLHGATLSLAAKAPTDELGAAVARALPGVAPPP